MRLFSSWTGRPLTGPTDASASAQLQPSCAEELPDAPPLECDTFEPARPAPPAPAPFVLSLAQLQRLNDPAVGAEMIATERNIEGFRAGLVEIGESLLVRRLAFIMGEADAAPRWLSFGLEIGKAGLARQGFHRNGRPSLDFPSYLRQAGSWDAVRMTPREALDVIIADLLEIEKVWCAGAGQSVP